MDRKVKGITIMEVLVVMAIIAILASASILGLRNLVQREALFCNDPSCQRPKGGSV